MILVMKLNCSRQLYYIFHSSMHFHMLEYYPPLCLIKLQQTN